MDRRAELKQHFLSVAAEQKAAVKSLDHFRASIENKSCIEQVQEEFRAAMAQKADVGSVDQLRAALEQKAGVREVAELRASVDQTLRLVKSSLEQIEELRAALEQKACANQLHELEKAAEMAGTDQKAAEIKSNTVATDICKQLQELRVELERKASLMQLEESGVENVRLVDELRAALRMKADASAVREEVEGLGTAVRQRAESGQLLDVAAAVERSDVKLQEVQKAMEETAQYVQTIVDPNQLVQNELNSIVTASMNKLLDFQRRHGTARQTPDGPRRRCSHNQSPRRRSSVPRKPRNSSKVRISHVPALELLAPAADCVRRSHVRSRSAQELQRTPLFGPEPEPGIDTPRL